MGQRLFELAGGAVLLYGGYIVLFFTVPAPFFLAAWIFRRLRRKPLSEQVAKQARRQEEVVEQARRIRLLQDGPH